MDVASELCALGFGSLAAKVPAEQEHATIPGPPRRAIPTVLEQALRSRQVDFDRLALLSEGESKVVRLWTERVVLVRLKPTVYSYTSNRYGVVPGTDVVRTRFSAEVFRRMSALKGDDRILPRSAFLAEIESSSGPLLAERRVETCNLEVRVKRYHVGSPLHRYRFTEVHPTTQSGGPLRRWSRLDSPVVCFDWRHPLWDTDGSRLADEPLSDDYAAVWMEDVSHAKEMARATFEWLESMFETANVRLVDMCLFIDKTGHTIYGEVSPDCMRVRLGLEHPEASEAMDKDVWRSGQSAEELLRRYDQLYRLILGDM